MLKGHLANFYMPLQKNKGVWSSLMGVMSLKILKPMWNRIIAKSLLNEDKMKAFTIKSWTKQRHTLSISLSNIVYVVLHTALRKEERKQQE